MPGVVVKFDAAPIRPPKVGTVESTIFCPCDFRCNFEEKVFADVSGDGIKNDITDFLFKKIAAADTILIQLVKDGVIMATIIDDTYGAYYNGFAVQPLYVGWQADWTKIYNVFSGGKYQVYVTTTILGQETLIKSRYFRLNAFDELEAESTAKIETLQYGKLAHGEFDFRNLIEGGWPTSIRLPGRFGYMQPTLERDVYQDSSYREVQNRDTIKREYKLMANMVPESIQDRLAIQDVLGNEIFVTTYGVLQEKKYERLPVVAESFSDVRYDGLGNTYFEITFSDRQKNIIKTNVS